jgi:S-adenosylmethionine/arginine decarboxylase-like enzyme
MDSLLLVNGAVYLDVFSCAPYDPLDVAKFATEYFKAAHYQVSVVNRR